MDIVEGIVKKRLEALRSRGDGSSYEDDHMETECGTRGLIRITDRQGEVVGLEFIEPEDLWFDPDAVEEYAETLEDGISVTVIVPDEERLRAEATLREEVGREVKVLSYSEIGKLS
ncbi:MAG: hypothetical protein ISF22_07720 [Methanomassiliicoccus sp.]|nr:hypothetical protein [Methanomassiliicoccus sp.]